MSVFAMLDPRSPLWNAAAVAFGALWILWIGYGAPDS